MSRAKSARRSVRTSVMLDDKEYAELTRLAAGLDLSAARMIPRAVSEFVARRGGKVESRLPLRPASQHTAGSRKIGGIRGQ